VQAAAASHIINKPEHWEIWPQLAWIIQSNQFEATKIFHVAKNLNLKPSGDLQTLDVSLGI
jgi:hypothetical protein